MFFSVKTGRDPSWIILVTAFLPDCDIILREITLFLHRPFGIILHHGQLHNILSLVIMSLLAGVVLLPFGIRFLDGVICTAVGFATHLFGDALVYKPAYAFLYPFSLDRQGLALLPETRNFFGIADTTTLCVTILILVLALAVRTRVEGPGWTRVFLRLGRKPRGPWVEYSRS